MENLKEIYNYPDTYNILKLNQEQICDLNRPIASNQIGTVNKSLPTKKKIGPDGLTPEFHQTLKEELRQDYFGTKTRKKK